MPLKTTVIGSFPKPSYVSVPDWFQRGTGAMCERATLDYNQLLEAEHAKGDDSTLDAELERATREVLEVQRACGVEVCTDGEVRRENYIHYLCRVVVDGIDFKNLTETSCRNGAYVTSLPTVRSRVTSKAGAAEQLASEWANSQATLMGLLDEGAAAKKPRKDAQVAVKYTIPGPMTIIGTVNNAFYDSEKELAADLTVIVNEVALALVKAGCQHLQIDEPLFARKPEQALDWGIAMLNRCLEGIDGAQCERTVHICCGYPEYLDQRGYLKADPRAYSMLAPQLDDAPCVDIVSIEDAHRPNDLAELLPKFRRTKVALGTVHIASSEVESVGVIEARLAEALKYIDATRLVVAPDCGLALLPEAVLTQKLTNMCTAARRCGCTAC